MADTEGFEFSLDMVLPEPKEDKGSDAVAIVGLVLIAIYDGNKENVVKYLERIPIVKLTPKRQVNLLDIFMGKIYEDNRTEMVEVVFDYFDKVHEKITDLSTISLFVMRSGIPDEILEYIGTHIQKQTFESIIQDISDYPISPASYEGCVNVEKMFGHQDRHIYEKLEAYLMADPNELNNYVYGFVRDNLDETSPYKPRPKYIISNKGKVPIQEDLVTPDFPDIRLPSPDDAAKRMVKFVKEIEKKVDEKGAALAIFSSQYSISTLDQKLKMLSGIVGKIDKDISSDATLFQIYGPCNTIDTDEVYAGDPSETQSDPCALYGGCRMFICECFDQPSDDEGDTGDYDNYWFTGICEACRLRVKYPHYALREPLLYGGWRGCFCSLECVKDAMVEKDSLHNALLDRIEEQLEDIGILDRKYSDNNQRITSP
jgi:hypothetical protein